MCETSEHPVFLKAPKAVEMYCLKVGISKACLYKQIIKLPLLWGADHICVDTNKTDMTWKHVLNRRLD